MAIIVQKIADGLQLKNNQTIGDGMVEWLVDIATFNVKLFCITLWALIAVGAVLRQAVNSVNELKEQNRSYFSKN